MSHVMVERDVKSTRVWMTLAAAAVAAGIGVLMLTLRNDHAQIRVVGHPELHVFVPLIGWSFVGAGLMAWMRQPRNGFGRLMVAVGFAWFAAGLTAANGAILFSIGLVITPVWIALFVHALLAFPTGRLESRLAKAVVGLFYADALTLQVVWAAFAPMDEASGCTGCPENVFAFAEDAGIADTILLIQQPIIGSLALLGCLVVLVKRWKDASQPRRYALSPVFLSGGVCLAVLIFTISIEPFSRVGAEPFSIFGGVAFAAVPLGFLAGVLRQRLAHVAVGELVMTLDERPAEPDLQDALSRALKDPSLRIAFWSPRNNGYVGADGRPIILRAESGRSITVVEHGGERVAALEHDPSLVEDPQLLRAVCAAAGLALSNARLQAELRSRLEELKASRSRILEIGDTERRRLERDLHDGAQQRLLSIALSLKRAETKLASDPDAKHLVSWSRQELERSLAELREIARGIHPATLSDHGLGVALEDVAARASVPTELRIELHDRLPRSVEAAAYYLVSESLANIARHAGATAATVILRRTDGRLFVEVSDDGIGGADPSRGTGLRGMMDRVSALDGRLELESREGIGTRVRAEIPCV